MVNSRPARISFYVTFVAIAFNVADSLHAAAENDKLLTGKAAMGDWTSDAPGVRRKITVQDLPPPGSNALAINLAHVVKRPANAQPKVPSGFKIELYASGFRDPRFLLTAPNGDLFVVESRANQIKVLRDTNADGKAEVTEVFADRSLNKPFGIAFYPPGGDPQFLYVANTDGVIRFPYRNGDLKARGPAEQLGARLSGGAAHLRSGGHWTRDIVFSPDGKKMYVSIGSRSNVSDSASEADRARIFEFNPDGTDRKVFAWGIRNAVGIAFRLGTNELWMSTNERDELGEDLPPDYISSVRLGGFYGWPWFYIGNHSDPRHKGKHPELAGKVIVPDVLVQAHSASLNLCFYTGDQFPSEYKGDIFAAFHGSWNRMKRTGYKVVRVPFDKSTGKPRGEYEDFVTGFVTPDGKVWGRPVGIVVAKDGSLLISEDGNGTIWRVSHGR
ncbi:MAG: sorbosone dehydrogenase [Verrucomicrobia bacterium]|jgi:glucose/arabinose dehydrogenase|nr:MAG: sorbosone dehydrogenase [Verrucomicrobiota bacterium]